MRVTGGTGRGRRLKVPAGSGVRPTSDKVKQALFNILGQKAAGAVFLDLYAGAGGIGIEALSRGAAGAGILKSDAVVIAEHFKKQPSPERAGSLTLLREAKYGDTVLAFYMHRA